MDLPNNYFKDKSPAEIIAKVATITLANISLLGASELRRIGWLDNPVIDILYSLTSAGVWIARTNASGLVTEGNSATINTYSGIVSKLAIAPTISSVPGTTTIADNYHHRIGILGKAFTSNAAGGFDADVDLIAALAGYYGVLQLNSIKASQIVAAGATLVIHDGDGNLIYTLTLPALVANVPQTLGELKIFIPALTDNKSIKIDTTSHDLGNATVFDLDYEYWWET